MVGKTRGPYEQYSRVQSFQYVGIAQSHGLSMSASRAKSRYNGILWLETTEGWNGGQK